MKYIKYFDTLEEYQQWMSIDENADEAYRNEEKICVDGLIFKHTNDSLKEAIEYDL